MANSKRKSISDSVIAGIISAFITGVFTLVATYLTLSFSQKKQISSLEKSINERNNIVKTSIPETNPLMVQSLDSLQINGSNKCLLLKDISIFDLRDWVYTPKEFENTRFSPVYYTDYLHYKKTAPIDSVLIIYGNTGKYYDLQCLTHKAIIMTDSSSFKSHLGEEHDYGVVVDISQEPINKEFVVVVRGILWNSFNDTTRNDASTYTDNDYDELNELAIMVIFPNKKPFKGLPERKTWPTDQPNKLADFTGLENFHTSKDGGFIFWAIKDHQPNHHYQLRWLW